MIGTVEQHRGDEVHTATSQGGVQNSTVACRRLLRSTGYSFLPYCIHTAYIGSPTGVIVLEVGFLRLYIL